MLVTFTFSLLIIFNFSAIWFCFFKAVFMILWQCKLYCLQSHFSEPILPSVWVQCCGFCAIQWGGVYLLSTDSNVLLFLNVLFIFIFEREWERAHTCERAHMSRGGAERERDTESKAGSRLWPVSSESDVGLKLLNHEIMTWVEVRCSTDWATQAPLFVFFYTLYQIISYLSFSKSLVMQFILWILLLLFSLFIIQLITFLKWYQLKIIVHFFSLCVLNWIILFLLR